MTTGIPLLAIQQVTKGHVKKCIGKKEYLHHARHVLEKTQTETYLEFCSLHPEINFKQRKFENLQPFSREASQRVR